jgi:hypothetical protein
MPYGDERRLASEWPDTRVNDLARLVHVNDERLDELQERVNDHDNQLTAIMKTGDRRSERNWMLTLTLVTVLLSTFANVLISVLHH